MKKIFMIAIAAMIATVATAQEKMKVVLTDGTTTEFIVKKVERVYFEGQDIVLNLGEVSNITVRSAIIPFSLEGAEREVTAGILLSTSSTIDCNNYQKEVTMNATNGKFTAVFTDLDAGTTYFYRAFAKIEDICFYSDEILSFTTLENSQGTIYREPCVTWGSSVAHTKEYMSDYYLLYEMSQGTQTILTYLGKDKESSVVYLFENAKLIKSTVVLDTGITTQESVANHLNTNGYVSEGKSLHDTFMYLSTDSKTIVEVETHSDDSFYINYYEFLLDEILFEVPYINWSASKSRVKSEMAKRGYELTEETITETENYIHFNSKHEEEFLEYDFNADQVLDEIDIPFLLFRVSQDDLCNYLSEKLSYSLYWYDDEFDQPWYLTPDENSFAVVWLFSVEEKYYPVVSYLNVENYLSSRAATPQELRNAMIGFKSLLNMDVTTIDDMRNKVLSEKLRIKKQKYIQFDINTLLKKKK